MNYLIELSLMAVIISTITARSAAQDAAPAMQKGIRVELAVTSHAAPVPDADKDNSVVVTITATGSLYFGIDPVDPSALTDTFKRGLSKLNNKTLYVKADARAPYTSLVEVLDAARAAGPKSIILLTEQPNSAKSGTPEGLQLWLGPLS